LNDIAKIYLYIKLNTSDLELRPPVSRCCLARCWTRVWWNAHSPFQIKVRFDLWDNGSSSESGVKRT
jgi:hypothetical protein